MTEELDQLLRNLKLHGMRAVFDEHLRAAEADKESWSAMKEFFVEILR